MNSKVPKCTCGGSLLVGSFLPDGFLYQCTCTRRWLRIDTDWVEIVEMRLRDGRVWTFEGTDHE